MRRFLPLLALAACGLLPTAIVQTDSATTETGGTTTPIVPTTTTTTTTTTDPDPYGVVSAHNAVRHSAVPTPDPALVDLVWDQGLADVAAAWAARCVWEHSGNEYGENIYASSWESTGAEVVADWASEIADYDYASNTCSDVCGHYTQIVWDDTRRVGCAYVDCGDIDGLSFDGRFWVCNYDPPGNMNGDRPY